MGSWYSRGEEKEVKLWICANWASVGLPSGPPGSQTARHCHDVGRERIKGGGKDGIRHFCLGVRRWEIGL